MELTAAAASGRQNEREVTNGRGQPAPRLQWDRLYVVSKSLILQIHPAQKLIGINSVSRVPQEINPDAVPVMLCFAQPCSPRQAIQALRHTCDFEEDGFGTVVAELIARNLVTPVEPTVPTGSLDIGLSTGGFGWPFVHCDMLRDSVRVMSYKAAIAAHVRDKHVVEIGCGTGVLSLLAAKAGARKVTAIEESVIAELARKMFAANGFESTIELRLGNSMDITIDEAADVILHELIGVDPFDENLLSYIADARDRWLAKGGRLIPHRLEVCCVGVEIDAAFERDRAQRVAHARELSGLYDLDFEPLATMLSTLHPRFFPRPPGVDAAVTVLTDETRLLDLDFYAARGAPASTPSGVELRVCQSGTLGAVQVYFRAHLDEHAVLGTGPDSPPTHWGRDVRPLSRRVDVKAGEDIVLTMSVQNIMGRDSLLIDLD
jgi:hypothetical protein